MSKKIIIVGGDGMSRQEWTKAIQKAMGQDTGTTIHNTIVGPDGKPMKTESTFAQFPQELCDKINVCMEEMEPFGLSSEDSVVVFLPTELAACWYDKDCNKTILRVADKQAFVFMLTGFLYTHTCFMGPLMTHKFVMAAKIIQDERERNNSQPTIPPANVPDPGKPAGPMETGEG